MDMLNMKNLILFVFLNKVLLQFNKSISLNGSILKNAKPSYKYFGFAYCKPKSRNYNSELFVSFWLIINNVRVK